jgi:hypothetical protein
MAMSGLPSPFRSPATAEKPTAVFDVRDEVKGTTRSAAGGASSRISSGS